jgi:TolA-binding protein
LSGNTEKAAAVYAQLCQEYPDSPYAILAYAKLEP